MPSFSKEFVGGFVIFEWVTIDPNQKNRFQIFCSERDFEKAVRAFSDTLETR
jgi:hypothetical protein